MQAAVAVVNAATTTNRAWSVQKATVRTMALVVIAVMHV
jgi:hypothetical protein